MKAMCNLRIATPSLYYSYARRQLLFRLIIALNYHPELAEHIREAAFVGQASRLSLRRPWFRQQKDIVHGILGCLLRDTPDINGDTW
jgi:hypothetical protein